MLQVKDLTKSYNMKKSKDNFGALKGITLDFPTKGFVFIIGKSGSGKSTLLNLLGGLDKPTGGEIIIKGKSSKDFSSKDFDSYRNTYLGFVFQEFNLLEHNTIEENVRLALELQSFKGNLKEKTDELMNQVEIYDKRFNKINQISGGQKQRVAIARALVKNPEIILADEPTGNLDSETSVVVMETLQKLSREKLVIMVTHDVDYAAKYADRVIELKDGQVISDVSKEFRIIGETGVVEGSQSGVEKVIRLPKTGALEPETISMINEMTRNNPEENLYLALSFKKDKIAEIDPASLLLSKEYQEEIEKVDLNYQYDKNFKLIKSKLPFTNTFKMAFGNIWRKKVRNLFTMLILVGSIFMFGFAETVNRYDYGSVVANTFDKGEINLLEVRNSQKMTASSRYGSTTVSDSATFDAATIAKLEKDFSTLKFHKTYNINFPMYVCPQLAVICPDQITSAIEVTSLTQLGFKESDLIEGTLAQNGNEVVISDLVKKYINTQVGQTIPNTTLKVVGVFKTDVDTKFPYLKEEGVEIDAEKFRSLNAAKQDKWTSYRSIISSLLVNDEFHNHYLTSTNGYLTMEASNRYMHADKTNSSVISSYANINKMTLGDFKYVTPGVTTLAKDEVLMNKTVLQGLLGLTDDEVSSLTYPQTVTLKPTTLSYFKQDKIETKDVLKTVKIMGVYEYNDSGNSNKLLLSGKYNEFDMIVNQDEFLERANFVSLHVRLGSNINENARFFRYAKSAGFTYTSTSMMVINIFDMIVKALGAVFKFISIALAVFAAILLFQNISASVLAKKKEIGTLRAIGARGWDVAKIFLVEALFITLLTGIFSTFILNSLSKSLNGSISSTIGYQLSLFNVSWFIVMEIFILAVVLGVISAFIPSFKVAKMKPIDAIKDR